MSDFDRRQRVIDSTPRVSPDDVANRTFAKGYRGYAESEVRSFLRRVAEEMTALRDREDQLLAVVDDLEAQLRSPRPLDEQQLLDALGEETARLLRTAREAAEEIRKKAEDQATKASEEAQAAADRQRTEAAEAAETALQNAQANAAEIIAAAEANAAEVRDATERTAEERRLAAEREIEEIIEAARAQGREMVDEALAARERILADLARRRGLLQSQVEELRQGRDHLLDAYRVVKRTFLEATEALAHVEARAAAGKPLPSADTEDIDAVIAAEHVAVTATEGAAESDVLDIAAAEAEGEAGTDAETDTRSDLSEVDSLFARLRAGHDEAAATGSTENAEAAAETTTDAAESAAESEIEIVLEASETEIEVDDIDTSGANSDGDSAGAWRARHEADVAGLLSPLLKRAKRKAQDDQNALLDAVRRHKGRPTAAQVLPTDETFVAAWVAVLGSTLEGAYGAGRAAGGAEVADAPSALMTEAALVVVTPLRERIVAAIDDEQDDASGLVERIGARYREWKNQQLEALLGDAIVVSWSRGVYDAAGDGDLLHWIPVHDGRCADCDDNALEPTAKGADFPTGQAFPPAHPGCRCLLAPAPVLEKAAATTRK